MKKACWKRDWGSKWKVSRTTSAKVRSADANSAPNTASSGTASSTPNPTARSCPNRAGRGTSAQVMSPMSSGRLEANGLQAQGAEREHEDQAEQVEEVERGGVAAHQRHRAEEGGDGEPRGVGRHGQAPRAHDPGAAGHERESAQRDVESPRHRPQQLVAEDAAQGGDGEDRQADPGALVHEPPPIRKVVLP